MKQGLEDKENHLLSFVLAIAAGLAVFIFNAHVTGPTIQPDEASYLATAAAIAGYQNDFASNFYGGYSILIAPAFLIAETPSDIWSVVRAINATLFASSVFALCLLAKYFSPTSTLRQRYAAVGVVSLYPAWVIMAGYSSAQVAFVPVFLFMLLTYLRAIHGGLGIWLILGVLSGVLFWVHPTGIASIIAIVCSAFYVASVRNKYNVFVVFLLVIICMVFIYLGGMSWLLQEKMSISGLEPNHEYPSVEQFFSPLTSMSGIKEMVARIAGQVFYVSLGSVGLLGVGLYSLIPDLKAGVDAFNKTVLQERAVAIFIWFALMGTIMITALVFTAKPESMRLDEWIHGRYIEGVLAPIILAGVLNMSGKKILWTIPIAIFCTWVLYSEIDSYDHTLRVNISALWQDYYIHEQGVWGWLAAGIMVILVVAIVPRSVGLIVITAIFSFSGYLHITSHIDSSVGVKLRWAEALRIREQFAPGTCVGFDYSGVDNYNKYVFWKDFSFILYDYQLKRMSHAAWMKNCNGPLFSYSEKVNSLGDNIHLAGVTPLGGPMVWEKGDLAKNVGFTKESLAQSTKNHTYFP